MRAHRQRQRGRDVHVHDRERGAWPAWRRGARALAAAAATAGLVACDGAGPVAPSDDGASPTLGLKDQASLEWLLCPAERPCGVHASVALRTVACSAAIGCSEALLHDAQGLRRPTLVTGFSCAFPTGADAQDALLGFHPRLLCYDAGDPAVPASWAPAGGIAVAPAAGENVFYADADPATGRTYTDTARLLAPVADHAFCALDAWGFVAFAAADAQPRRLQHEQFATAVEWHGVLVPGAGGFDCHTDPGDLTWVRRTTAVSITHDRPDPSAKGELPATHTIVMILDDSEGLRAVAVADSTFPAAAHQAPEPFLERSLAIALPGVVPSATWTCPDVVAGRLVDVAVRLEDADVHAPIGAVVVKREVSDALGTRAWDCERDASGACVLYDDPDVPAQAPCLLPIVLAH